MFGDESHPLTQHRSDEQDRPHSKIRGIFNGGDSTVMCFFYDKRTGAGSPKGDGGESSHVG